ncbi:phosphotransferase family protein [Cercophora scortea]|uniref:Phosphotransferase family protein n=1 Tax=Cercophora scortea TaxID=314031 RepID=A0AAE0IXB0_9PEZI|nr:phosphotransferase family protein [Cercophora scortea]
MATKKARRVHMFKDDLAWEKSDEEFEAWVDTIHTPETYRAIGNMILKYKPGEAELLHMGIKGGYNVLYRLEYKDGTSVAMRLPLKGGVKFPEEKVRYEVATMRYISQNTTIPVPHVYHYGSAAENPTGLGPFIIMDYVEHDQTMSAAMNDPDVGDSNGGYHELDPNIGKEKLEFCYRQMADVLLQLSRLKFPRIGSLDYDDQGKISVVGRPLTQNMNFMVELGSVLPELLPTKTYSNADDWYSALADMHLAQLTFQHNDAVEDEDDARDKYVARQLFRHLAAERRLTRQLGSEEDDPSDDCTIFCEDLRPSNVLVDKDLRIVGVIDWEFAYVAPAQFARDPPGWLLLKTPDDWPTAYAGWMEACRPRFEVFVRLLEEEEKKLAEKEQPNKEMADLSVLSEKKKKKKTLSQHMRERWESKSWLLSFAARNSWAFDAIFWKYLDEQYFGPNELGDYHARLGLLTPAEADEMEPFVQRKMEESKVATIVKWEVQDAVAHLAKVLL